MNRVWTFRKIYSSFLTFTASCTLADLNDEELEHELEHFLLRALADFRFPQVSLDYEWVDDEQYYRTFKFIDPEFGQREVNVILEYMKAYFFEWILSREKNFEQQYYDTDTRTHSQANMVQQINTAYKAAIKQANDSNYDYTRSNAKRKPRIGSVNE